MVTPKGTSRNTEKSQIPRSSGRCRRHGHTYGWADKINRQPAVYVALNSRYMSPQELLLHGSQRASLDSQE
jgi:hypothetical protein